MKFIYLIIIVALIGCDEMPRTRQLQQSYGGQNSLTVVLDTSNCPDSIYQNVFNSLTRDYPGVSQKSPQFIVHNRYDNMNGKSKEHHLQIHINNLSDSTNVGLENKILLQPICKSCDSYPCIKIVHDQWALNQTIVLIAVNNFQELDLIYRANEQKIIDACEAQVINSYQYTMNYLGYFNDTTNINLSNSTITLAGSKDYQTVTDRNDLFWMRKAGDEFEESIFAMRIPNYHDSQFTDSTVLQIKDSISNQKNGLFDGLREISVEKRIPLRVKRIKLNDIFVLEAVGQWKMTSQPGVGGRFISYVIPISKEKGSVYLEGFLFDPGPKEAESLRRLKIILNTLEIDTNG